MLRILALIAVLALSTIPAMAQGNVVATPDLSGFKGRVNTLYGKTLTILEAEFPDDFAVFEATLDEIRRANLPINQKMTAAFVALTEIRKKYADKVQFAPDADLQRVMIYLSDFYTLVREGAGAEVCGRFAKDGAGVLFDLGVADKYRVPLDEQSAAFFAAVVGAIENPTFRGGASDKDWDTIIAAMLEFGGTPDDVVRIAESDPEDPELCRSLIGYFRTIGVLDSDAGERARADFAKNTTGY